MPAETPSLARPLVALVGPTAAGKTALALRVGERARGRVEVISLDSRQVYRRLEVGTGKPSAQERARLPHHLLDRIDPDETFTAGRYRREVEALLPSLWARGVVPLLVGGAGFYLRALAHGLVEVSDDPPRLAAVRRRLEGLGLEELRRRLGEVDPASAARLHAHDRYRIQRALEIHELTGAPLSSWNARFSPQPVRGVRLRVVHLSPPRVELHRKVAARATRWFEGGWREEVEALLLEGIPADAPGLRILGYREIVAWVQGALGRERALERIIVRTRQYARQQEIWFRKAASVARGAAEDAAVENALLTELDAAAAWLDSDQIG
jgi:tRNA dimethylallyltransferase